MSEWYARLVALAELYDPAQPRDDHGRWSDGGDGGEGIAPSPRPKLDFVGEWADGFPDGRPAKPLYEWAHAVAQRTGWPGPINLSPDTGPPTTVGEGSFTTSGLFFPASNVTQIFLDHMDPESVEAVISHESTHGLFKFGMWELDRQQEELRGLARARTEQAKARPGGPDWSSAEANFPTRGISDDRLQPQLKDKYPLAYAYEELWWPGGGQALAESGSRVSGYAKSWWDAWKAGKASTRQAMNETVAEVGAAWTRISSRATPEDARKILTTESYGHSISPEWLDFHAEIVKAGRAGAQAAGVRPLNLSFSESTAVGGVTVIGPEGWGERHEADGTIRFLVPMISPDAKLFDPDEPRDDHGRWTSVGASGTRTHLEAAGWRHRMWDSTNQHSHADFPDHNIVIHPDGSWLHLGRRPDQVGAPDESSTMVSPGDGRKVVARGKVDELRPYLRSLDHRKLYEPDQPRLQAELFDHEQPRVPAGQAEGGQWTSGGSNGAADSRAGTVRTSDVDVAVHALAQGHRVVLTQPRQVSTLLDRMAAFAREAEARGEKAPFLNLCDVAVENTNLFCAGGPGVARAKMPQFTGKPAPGSKADALPRNDHGNVDLAGSFVDHLHGQGVSVSETTEDAKYLRASQGQLNGVKVGQMMQAYRGHNLKDAPIFVSRDNYVLDGHHRWAALVGLEYGEGREVRMAVRRIDLPITALLSTAKRFSDEWGLSSKPAESIRTTEPWDARLLRLFDPDQPRAPAGSPDGGQWTASGGGDGGSRVEAQAEFRRLKGEWAHVNNELLEHCDNPNSPQAQEKMDRLKVMVKQMYRLDADPGGLEGIGLPGGPRDLVIVGAGPGGLSAAVMGGADGLDTMFIDANTAVGGQAKFSSRIENYPGFPVGTTGQNLANNMYDQALRVGAEGVLGVRATGLSYDEATGLKTVTLSDGRTITARAVVLAGGVEFSKMNFPGSDSASVIYGDGEMVRKSADGKVAVILGGSNGAAQAALGAARSAKHVYVVSRSAITKGMSGYQVTALRAHPKIQVIENDEIVRLWTDEHGHATAAELKSGKRIDAHVLGVFIGGGPNLSWLPAHIERHEGKLKVDHDLQTNMPGVFAVGDTRHGSIGRIGAAVGDGQMAERNVWQYFERLKKGKP